MAVNMLDRNGNGYSIKNCAEMRVLSPTKIAY
jgi:hypothetical protein